MSKFVKSVKKWTGVDRPSTPELSRSQYSLVSCGELTAEAIQVWLGLPKKIKYDPELAPFRQLYEKEFGNAENIPLTSNGSAPETKRLPLVKSAPHLNNNHVKASANEVSVNFKDPEKKDGEKQVEKNDHGSPYKKDTKIAKARHYVKMFLLIACWTFFTIVFMLYNEKEDIKLNSFIAPGKVKNYFLNVSSDKMAVLVKLSGPFLPEHMEKRMNSSQMLGADKIVVWLQRWNFSPDMKGQLDESKLDNTEASGQWSVYLQPGSDIDFSRGEKRSALLGLTSNATGSNTSAVYAIRMKTTSNQTVPLTMSYTVDPVDTVSGVTYACLLLCGLYVLIIFEVINRTMASIIIASTSLAVLALIGERPSVPELISWLDVETLLLLFSMMLLVAITAETGIFDFLAVFTFEVTRGKLWPLISLLCAITGLLSTFLDNVTTVLLMTPVTIRLCEVMNLDPIPILMSMVLFSNIGGTATPVGDPPNVIIASNKAVIQSGINFTNFTLHMTFGIILVCVQTYFQLRFIYRDTSKLRLDVPRDIQGTHPIPSQSKPQDEDQTDTDQNEEASTSKSFKDDQILRTENVNHSKENLNSDEKPKGKGKDIRHQISIWRRAIESLPHLSKDERVVRERLERKVTKLNSKLAELEKESTKRVFPKETFQSTLVELKEKYKIRDKSLLIKASIAISFVVIVFFLHSIPELNRVSLGWTALLGAILLLTLADREDLEPILHRVEWSTLLFFASLFVLMEALSKLGLIEFIGGITQAVILSVDESARLAVALLLMLWVSGVTSAFVDNIPLTTMMVRVVTSLGSNPQLGLPMAPLIWALSFGACLGGNGTLIGASANVVCAGVAEQHGYKFSFMRFFKVGFPVMIGHLVMASIYLILCHCVFTWH